LLPSGHSLQFVDSLRHSWIADSTQSRSSTRQMLWRGRQIRTIARTLQFVALFWLFRIFMKGAAATNAQSGREDCYGGMPPRDSNWPRSHAALRNRSGDSRAVMVSDETTHEGRRTRGYIARSTMNFSSQILFRFYNRDHGGIDGADVVSWGQHDLQSPNARGYGDHIADFRELIDIHGVVSLAG